MTEPAKFLFDQGFGEHVEEVDEAQTIETELRTQFEGELLQVRELALREGRQEGEQSARDSLDAKTSETLDKLVGVATEAAKNIDEICLAYRTDALKFAVMAADKLASGILKRDPTAALERLFDECFELVNDAPHVAIRVNEQIADKIQTRVEEAAKTKGFEGEILVIPDPDVALGDGRLEWADGGATRSYQEIRDRIENSVSRYIEILNTTNGRTNGEAEVNDQQSTSPQIAGDGNDVSTELGEMA